MKPFFMRPERCHRSGWSLLELMVVMGIISGTAGVLTMSLQATSGVVTEARADAGSQHRLNLASSRVVREIRNASTGTLAPALTGAVGEFVNDVTFWRVESYQDGAASLGSAVRLFVRLEALEIDDDLDNDGDGLIDELELCFTADAAGPTPKTVVVARGLSELARGESSNGLDDNGDNLVDEGGFVLRRVGDLFEVRLTVDRVNDQGQVQRLTRSTFLNLRQP